MQDSVMGQSYGDAKGLNYEAKDTLRFCFLKATFQHLHFTQSRSNDMFLIIHHDPAKLSLFQTNAVFGCNF